MIIERLFWIGTRDWNGISLTGCFATKVFCMAALVLMKGINFYHAAGVLQRWDFAFSFQFNFSS